MLLRSSAPIYPSIYLLTLGSTCRYAIISDDTSIALSDPGASIHVANLAERMKRIDLRMENITRVFLTHLDADRFAGIPLLRRSIPGLQVYGTAAMHALLQDETFAHDLWREDQEISSCFAPLDSMPRIPFEEFKASLRIDKYLVDSDAIILDEDLTVRAVSTPGHRKHSVSYLVVPHEFVITDETFGYNQGRRLCAPGGDFDLFAALESVKKFNHIEISGIGLPYVGAITGDLVRKHLDMLHVNTNDLINEVKQARDSGIEEDDIKKQVYEAFYTPSLRDPCFIRSLSRSFEQIWAQVYRA
jgi:glyoxylase-like metal-dependent hydrolase (beta-lactamase superfamily II)